MLVRFCGGMKTHLGAVVLVLALLFSAVSAEARSVYDITFFVIEPDLAMENCESAVAVYGCFVPEDNSILLSSDIPPDLFEYVFFHEVGHFYTHDQDLRLFDGDKELAADAFALWIMGEALPLATDAFFTELLSN